MDLEPMPWKGCKRLRSGSVQGKNRERRKPLLRGKAFHWIDPGPPEENLIFRILDSFQELTKLRIRFIPVKEEGVRYTILREGPLFCQRIQSSSLGKRRCLKEIERATEMAHKTGEPYIFQCHADMVEFTAAVFDGNKNIGTLICGPILLRAANPYFKKDLLNKIRDLPIEESLLVDSLSEIPIFPERKVQAASDLLFTVANYFAKMDWVLEKQQQEIAKQQALLAEELGMRKKLENRLENLESTSSPSGEDFFNEKELIELIRRGDKKKARFLLDELLGTVLFRSHEHLGILKARMLEIIIIIARAAVEAGANLEEILGVKYHFFQELSKDDSQENLYYCLLKAFDQLFECIYQNRNIRHTRVFVKAKEFIWSNYNQNISLKKAGEVVGMSPYYLSHLFRSEMGISFSEYLTSVRTSVAKKLLEQTDMTILGISLEVGYQDPSYFSKIFRKKEGMNPGDYRNKTII
jgi:two-component system response regulator YesN